MKSRHLSVIAAVLFFGCSGDNSTEPNGGLALPPTVIKDWGFGFNSEAVFRPHQAQFKNNVLTFLETDHLSRYNVYGLGLSSWTWNNPATKNPVSFDQDAAGTIYMAFQSRQIRVESPDGRIFRMFPVGDPVQEPYYYPQLGEIALDGLGHLYVADIRDRLVRKYDLEGNLILQWGGEDTEPGHFQEPAALIVHTNGNIIVLDSEQRTVQIFDPTGVFQSNWYVSDSYPSSFYPGALTEGANGTVFVLDKYQRQGHVREYGLDGTMIREWGSDADGFSYFDQPTDITADRQGTVFVCDEFDNRVIAFSETGQFLRSWETRIPSGGFGSLRSVAVAPDGSVFSLEIWRGRVQKFTSDGAFVLQWGSPGQRVGQMFSPEDFGIDDDGNVFVADPYNQRVTKFDGEGHVLGWWQSKAEGLAVSPVRPRDPDRSMRSTNIS